MPPGRQHLRAGEGVLVEQRGQLGRQLHPLAVEALRLDRRGAARQVVPHRPQLRLTQPSLIVEQRQQLPLVEVAVDDPHAGRAGRRHLPEKAAQKVGFDVGGDPQTRGQRLFDVPLDQRVGKDQMERVKQAAPPRTDGVGQRVDERLEAVRAAKPDHERLF